jgi:hypothetical protein
MPVINRDISLKNRENESFVSILKNRAGAVLWLWGKHSDAATIADKANAPRTFLLLARKEKTRIIIAATSIIISGVTNLTLSTMFKMTPPQAFV